MPSKGRRLNTNLSCVNIPTVFWPPSSSEAPQSGSQRRRHKEPPTQRHQHMTDRSSISEFTKLHHSSPPLRPVTGRQLLLRRPPPPLTFLLLRNFLCKASCQGFWGPRCRSGPLDWCHVVAQFFFFFLFSLWTERWGDGETEGQLS